MNYRHCEIVFFFVVESSALHDLHSRYLSIQGYNDGYLLQETVFHHWGF